MIPGHKIVGYMVAGYMVAGYMVVGKMVALDTVADLVAASLRKVEASRKMVVGHVFPARAVLC